MRKVITNFVLLCLWGCSCSNHSDFAKAVAKDAQKNFSSHKEFFKSFSFEGRLDTKRYCEKCNRNKYQFVISLNMKKPDSVGFANTFFEPYYTLYRGNQLTISVPENIYNSLKEGDIIKKEPRSNVLHCNEQRYDLLSAKDFQWLAE